MSAFSDTLWEAAGPALADQADHPVVRGLAQGTLPLQDFRRFLLQDCLFIRDYARALSLTAARANARDAGTRFGETAVRLTSTELQLNLDLAGEFGEGEVKLEEVPYAPVTRAYTDFLLRTAALDDFSEVTAAILPCFWGYSALGKHLLKQAPSPERRYARWIEAYGSDSFAGTAAWCRDLVARIAESASAETRDRMCEAFVLSSRLEYSFWNVALEDAGALLWGAPLPRMDGSRSSGASQGT